MDLPVRKAVVWQVVGLLFYLVGMVLSLVVVVGLFVDQGPTPSGDLIVERIPVLLLSVAFIVVGRAIIWKFGGGIGGVPTSLGRARGRERDQTALERLGYHTSSRTTEELPAEVLEDDDETVVCTECGTPNEQGFTYCSNCSAELPD